MTESLYFDLREDHLPVLACFLALPGFDLTAMTTFLRARLAGLDRLIQQSNLAGEELGFLFTHNQVVAADWAKGRSGIK